MNQQYFQRMTRLIRNVQIPLQAITELNIKTMRNLSYLKPNELMNIKPEQLFERQVNLSIENGHKTLDYIKQMFDILEKTALISTDKLNETTDSVLNKTYPGNNPMLNPSNMMLDMAQAVFDPTNPMMSAAKEAFSSTFPVETPVDTIRPSKQTKANKVKKKEASSNALKTLKAKSHKQEKAPTKKYNQRNNLKSH